MPKPEFTRSEPESEILLRCECETRRCECEEEFS